MIVTVNPATEEELARYPAMSQGDIGRAIEAAYRDFSLWRNLSIPERSVFMRRVAELLRGRRERYASLAVREMGKPIGQAIAEVEKSAWVCDFYAERAEAYLCPEEVDIEDASGMVLFEPLGLVLGVMPWNFPYWQVFRFAAPALMAGNGVLVKHAPNVTGCAIAIEEVFRDAGFPENLYRSLHIDLQDVDRVTGMVIAHPHVRAVSVTGSTAAGRAVAEKAGRALKRSVMELGGSDPYLVLDDADLEKAVKSCSASRLLNSGQSCIAAKRFIVHRSLSKRFAELLLQRMLATRIGDPFDSATEVGPIARADLRERVHRQVEESVRAGAELLCGGAIPAGKGYFYPPTVLGEVKKGMAAYSEELFGPVAAIVETGDDDEAVAVANDSEYGLGSAVFSSDPVRAFGVASGIEAGNCSINAMVMSDPRLPFGGVKQSGYGRELSRYGIREFTNVKSLVIAR